MKQIFSAIFAAVLTLATTAVLGGCSETVNDTGNKIVNNVKSYVQSEAGVNGDVKSQAKEYAKTELGLNGNNDVIKGTWKQEDETNGDWVWTFDGSKTCHLQGITTGFESDGTYAVDINAKTVTVNMDGWDKQKVYTYKLRQTTSDSYLDLTESLSSYHLILLPNKK